MAERREQLLDAALTIIDRDGYDGVSIDAIAREAGVTRPVVYGAYDGLGPLLTALLDRQQERALAQLFAALPLGADDADPLAVVERAVARSRRERSRCERPGGPSVEQMIREIVIRSNDGLRSPSIRITITRRPGHDHPARPGDPPVDRRDRGPVLDRVRPLPRSARSLLRTVPGAGPRSSGPGGEGAADVRAVPRAGSVPGLRAAQPRERDLGW